MAAARPRLSRRDWLLTGALWALPSSLAAEPEGLPEVQEGLERLAAFVRGKNGRLSALVVDLETGRRASIEPGLALNPASNMKVVTAAWALDVLGPVHRFETGLYGSVSREMPLLVLRGDGDPSLTEAGLWRLADTLAALGVTRVNELLVDQSRFDDHFVPPAFEQQPSEWAAFRAPVSAIAVERNTVTMNVAPEKDGAPARVWFQPAGIVQASGQVATRSRGSGQNVQLELSGTETALLAKIGGHVAEGLPRLRFAKRVDDPRRLPGLVLRALLEQRGVSVGKVGLGGSAEKSRITFTSSDPLSELVNELGKNSDNFHAETLFKAVGGQGSTEPATWEGAASAATRWLQANDAFGAGTRVTNGSGLFDANRLSAETLCSVLTRAYQSPRIGSEFVSHLAIGGVDGTLRSRFRALKDSRRVRAKTGTLAKVDALSGYLLRQGRPPLVFSFLVNGLTGEHGNVRARVDEIVTILAAG